jgi:O-antigen/teichoic acid export membrane protein
MAVHSGRTITLNTVWNLLGLLAPLGVAVFAIPMLVRGIGLERFGVLTIAWMVAGYFSLFDFGLGRALTKLAAEHVGKGTSDQIPALVWTALVMMLALSTAGAALTWVLAPWVAGQALKIPPGFQAETIQSFHWLAISIPAVIGTTAFRGLLEANQRFGWVNALRVPMGVFNFLGPLAALLVSDRLDDLVAVLVLGRIGFALAHFAVCWAVVPDAMRPWKVDVSLVRPLLGFGGWMTVSNVVSPAMVYLDRFLIGSIVSMSAVAFYVTPYEMVTKLWVVPGALVSVLFPAFSASLATDPQEALGLLDRGIRVVFIALFPAVLIVVVLAGPVLEVWLGHDFATHSTRVLQWLAAGVLVNSMAQVPFAFIQGAGRPDMTAKLHLAELPAYLGLLWWGVSRYGIEGASIVWLARATVDGAALIFMTRLVAEPRTPLRPIALALAFAAALLLAGGSVGGVWGRAVFLGGALAASLLGAWRTLLAADERTAFRSRAGSLFRVGAR